MKTTNTLESLLVIACLLLRFTLQAQDIPPITIHVETAGTLHSLMTEKEKYKTINLTVTGNLNGTDIRFIREMAGLDADNNYTDGQLSVLNLAEANIVGGGDYYYDKCGYLDDCSNDGHAYNYTKDNEIGNYMFFGCRKLSSIILPESVTSIGGFAFGGCYQLTSIIIPYRVVSIGEGIFYYCTNLTSVDILGPITLLPSNLFHACEHLTSITLPNSITSIESRAFYGLSNLNFVNIPNNVTSIGKSAFGGCTSLRSIAIPNNVTSIGESAFGGCTSLRSIAIPNGITLIENGLFYYCINLTSIVIPSNIASIGEFAFGECTGLTSVYATNPDPPQCKTNAFSNISTNCKLYVPTGSYYAYRNAPGWWNFENIIEMEETISYVEIYFNTGGKVLIDNEDISLKLVENGKNVSFTIMPNVGYRVAKVLYNDVDITGQIVNNMFTATITENSTFEVIFSMEENTSYVEIYFNTGGKVLIDNEEISLKLVENGKNVSFTIMPNVGYKVAKVLYNDVDVTDQIVNNTFTIVITKNSIFEVVFSNGISIEQTNSSQLNVYSMSDLLIIEGAKQGEKISIYNQAGLLIKSIIAGSYRIEIQLPHNQIFIIKGSNETVKIVL